MKTGILTTVIKASLQKTGTLQLATSIGAQLAHISQASRVSLQNSVCPLERNCKQLGAGETVNTESSEEQKVQREGK